MALDNTDIRRQPDFDVGMGWIAAPVSLHFCEARKVSRVRSEVDEEGRSIYLWRPSLRQHVLDTGLERADMDCL